MPDDDLQLVSRDPLLFNPPAYRRLRALNYNKYRKQYPAIIKKARRAEKRVRSFCDYLETSLHEAERAWQKGLGIDPYYSTVFRIWFSSLERWLGWIDAGADSELLLHLVDNEALRRDLSLEYPAIWPRGRGSGIRSKIVGHSLKIVPVDAMAESPRLSSRVQQCLPQYPDPNRYLTLGNSEFEKVCAHFKEALAHLRRLNRPAFECLKENIHTIYVAITKKGSYSFGSRADCPGSVIAASTLERLELDDTICTAAQLYHEHCHHKLALYCDVLNPRLPPDSVYVSSFKNQDRDIESMLHTLYPITMECAIWLDSLSQYSGKARDRAISYLIAMGCRLQLVADIVRSDKASQDYADFRQVVALANDVLARIDQEYDNCIPRLKQAHRREKQKVLARHAWDIGQLLCRGIKVKDPSLERVSRTPEGFSYWFRGKYYTALPKPPRISQGNYGTYILPLLLDQTPAVTRVRAASASTL